MKTPITYYGGKQRMVSTILPLIPEHNLYVEPFAGGAAIFFAKPKSPAEVINDINGEVVNFYKVCATRFSELQDLIQSTPHSRMLHSQSATILKDPSAHDELKRAWAFWVQTNMSFSSNMFGGYAYERRGNSVSKKIANKRDQFTEEIKNRLDRVDIECNDALKVIKFRDTPDTFFYVDPPYFNSDMGHYGGYTDEDFEKLIKALSEVKGKFLLSSYPSEILERLTKKEGWYTYKITKKIAVTAKTDKIKTEVLTANYDINKMMKEAPKIKKEKPEALAEEKEEEVLEETLEGIRNKKSRFSVEEGFINKFLALHKAVVSKSGIKSLLIKLQSAIKKRKIKAGTPYTIKIGLIQDKLIALHHQLKGRRRIELDKELIKKLCRELEMQAAKAKKATFCKKKKTGLHEFNGIDQNQPRIMNSLDFVKLDFKGIGFKDKWLDFIGDPSKGFTTMVFGRPKFGKSYLCIEFAGYLARNHGKVLYVAREEELDATLKIKLMDKSVAHPNLYVSDHLPEDLSPYGFVFLDSVSKLNLSPEDLDKLEKKYPSISFIYIFQVRKDGVFRGSNEFQHDVDVVIEVPEKGLAVQNGRFNQGGEMNIFKEDARQAA
jgi:DNA adenine methylase